MVPLSRIRTVAAVKPAFRGAGKKQKDKELMEARRLFLNDATRPISFKSTFWKNAKDQLKIESFGKCAYCEADTDAVAHGDVEHYRPKSVYWWLAYTYDNYLFACQICNQVYKSDNFPVSGTIYPAPAITAAITDATIDSMCGKISPDPVDVLQDYKLGDYLAAHRAEQALLLNPYFDDPAQFIAYQFDETKQEVAIIPVDDPAKPYIKAMEDYYGINRIELKNLRYRVFTKFRILKKSYPVMPDQGLKAEIKAQLDDMLSPRYTFAGMNRYFDHKI
jgi:hypothetical protein